MTGPEGVVSGAVQVLVDQPLAGITQAAFPGSGVAAVGESRLGDRFVMPLVEDEAAGLSTGVAIFNGDLDGVRLIMYGPGGADDEIAIEHIGVPAGGHRVVFVRELFPGFSTFQGTLTVEAGFARAQEKGQLAAIGLQRGPNPNQLTTLPMILVGPSAPETLHFARFVSGGDTASALFLINPSPAARATGTLTFFGENGDGWSVAVNGLSPAASVPVDLPPLGSAVFATAAEGGLEVGSARVTITEGVIGGVLRYASSTGTVTVGSSSASTSLVSPVTRDAETRVNTEATFSSTGSAVTLTLELRDASGTRIPGGTAQLRLPANGHVTGTIDALFPDADTNSFLGVLTARSEGGTVAATVVQIGSDPAAIAAMPVTPLR